ncbi:MAG: hypothetical protein ABGY96_23815 [bacterium]|nr:hypothetical protein [Gammaproteobacteria bacterium]HIL95078.1 hypothetical protein [Pseudomonadales bacterium]
MNQVLPKNNVKQVIRLSCCLIFFSLGSCTYVPTHVDIELPFDPPLTKNTMFNDALRDLGMMSEIYGTYRIFVHNIAAGDDTGISKAEQTAGEIPQRISEMTASALNGIGGKVTYIPYLPNYLNSMQTIGYPNFENKMIPNVVLTGAITEFDRGLETRGLNADFGLDSKRIDSAPDWFDNKTVDVDASHAQKASTANITLDFNLIDYQSFAGIPGVQAVNSIRVYKTNMERELGFSLFGPSFGLKGSIQKVQGRHAAVRLLVQFNIIQIIGKLYDLPYWNLIPNAGPDKAVLDVLRRDFGSWNKRTQIIKVQEMLFLNDHDIPITGALDRDTVSVLQQLQPRFDPENGQVTVELYLDLYQSIPLTPKSLARRRQFDLNLAALLASIQRY